MPRTSATLRFLLLAAAVACSVERAPDADSEPAADTAVPESSSTSSALTECAPLTAVEAPIALETILLVGRDAKGVLYVVDRTAGGRSRERLFVSAGETLQRMRIAGSGSIGADDYTWSFETETGMRRLVAHRRDGELLDLAVLDGEDRTFFAELGPEAEILTPATHEEARKPTLRNFPGDVVLEFVATTSAGQRLVIT